jgi:hypothetical protein
VLLDAFTQAGYRPFVLPNFYDVRNYMLSPLAEDLPVLTDEPVHEVDIVFSRRGDKTLAL